MAELGLVHSLYRAHRAVDPATGWHLVIITLANLTDVNKSFTMHCK